MEENLPRTAGRRSAGLKWACLNDSTIQQHRTAQADHTTVLGKSTLRNGTKDSDSLSLQNVRKSIFSPAIAEDQWEALDSRIILQLDKHIGNGRLEHKRSTFVDIVYQTCLNTFGVEQHQARSKPQKSKRQREMETLLKQKKILKKQIKTAPQEGKRGLHKLWRGFKERYLALSNAETASYSQSQKK